MSDPRALLSIDCESNGLHGEAFAVGAVLFVAGEEPETFFARCPVPGGRLSEFVAENVIPALSGRPETHPNPMSLRDAFWSWYRGVKSRYPEVTVVSDVGWPVEARFLAACIDDGAGAREWEGPYPLHDVASLFLSGGFDPDADRVRFAEGRSRLPGTPHDPVFDATVSGLCALRLLGWTALIPAALR